MTPRMRNSPWFWTTLLPLLLYALNAIGRADPAEWIEATTLAQPIQSPTSRLSERERKHFVNMFADFDAQRERLNANERNLIVRLSKDRSDLKQHADLVAEHERDRLAWREKLNNHNKRCDRTFIDPADVARCDQSGNELAQEKISLDARERELAVRTNELQSRQAENRVLVTKLEDSYVEWAKRVAFDFSAPLRKALDQEKGTTALRLVAREQDEFDRMNAAWMRAQERLIREAVDYDSKWRNAVLTSFQTGASPNQTDRPKSMVDVLPGDILLFEPEGWSVIIPPLDRFYRAAGEFASGKVFAAIAQHQEPASHAVTVVKRVNDVTLFLDHTHVGSRILDQKELDRLYPNRKIYVARPQTIVNGRQLWETASAAALRRESDFGVTQGRLVCSERAGIAVAKATGLDLRTQRLGPIDITPADFFDSQSVGKYFVVSPLEARR